MKKYFIAVAALGILAACSGKQNHQKDVPLEVEEETFAVAEAAPDQPAMPILPAMKEKPAKPINMRDSLKVDPKKGAVIQKKYKGTVPAADGDDIVYDLTMYYQQDAEGDGVFEMIAIYPNTGNGNGQTYATTGKTKVKKGTPNNSNAYVYELIPSDGEAAFYFQAEGDSLTMLNQQLQQAASGFNYVLKQVK